jgi:AcrR family transcriptional regulator
MGRPRLTEKRRGEILAALERCMLRDGLANTTVQAVAAEAGFHRTLINHYFGDMESLVRALVVSLTDELTQSFGDATATSPGLPRVLDYLFRRAPSRANTLIGALRAPGIEAVDEPLARMYEAFASGLSACLRAEFPAAPAARCRSTAFAIVCLGMSRSQLTKLGVSQRHTQGLRSSAEVLIDSLRRG